MLQYTLHSISMLVEENVTDVHLSLSSLRSKCFRGVRERILILVLAPFSHRQNAENPILWSFFAFQPHGNACLRRLITKQYCNCVFDGGRSSRTVRVKPYFNPYSVL